MLIPPFDSKLAGERLRIALKANGKKYHTVALELGIKERTLKYWIDGSYFNFEKLKRCCEYLMVDIELFLIQEEDFDKNIFASRIQLPQKNSHPKEVLKIIFSGDDSLAIALSCQLITKKNILEKVSVKINGKFKNQDQVQINGKILDYKLNYYERSFRIISDFGLKYSIGGSNAILEDIAANCIEFHIRESENIFLNTIFYPYTNEIKNLTTKKEIENTIYNIGQISTGITMLKIKADIQSLGTLLSINPKSLPEDVLDLLFDSFRSFNNVYKKSDEISTQVSIELIKKIDFLLSNDHVNAAIYCIESIGYSATKNPANYKQLEYLIDSHIKNGIQKYHPDFALAALVALKNNNEIKLSLRKHIKISERIIFLSEIVKNSRS